jgi:hypothetical protein
MSFDGWYLYKAEQCDRLAANAADDAARIKFTEEAMLWRQIASDAAKLDQLPPPQVADALS